MNYRINNSFSIDVGFIVDANHIMAALTETNLFFRTLPPYLFTCIDYKTTSAMIGSTFCHKLAALTNSIVNPIEKGHPDIVPFYAGNATEEQLRMYPNDWGRISGTTGRNTKVSGMKVSGKTKMGAGWVSIIDDSLYIERYRQHLKFTT